MSMYGDDGIADTSGVGGAIGFIHGVQTLKGADTNDGWPRQGNCFRSLHKEDPPTIVTSHPMLSLGLDTHL